MDLSVEHVKTQSPSIPSIISEISIVSRVQSWPCNFSYIRLTVVLGSKRFICLWVFNVQTIDVFNRIGVVGGSKGEAMLLYIPKRPFLVVQALIKCRVKCVTQSGEYKISDV